GFFALPFLGRPRGAVQQFAHGAKTVCRRSLWPCCVKPTAQPRCRHRLAAFTKGEQESVLLRRRKRGEPCGKFFFSRLRRRYAALFGGDAEQMAIDAQEVHEPLQWRGKP